MSKNPYVEKFSKAFNIGLSIAVFIFLIVASVAFAKEVKAEMSVQPVPALCGPVENLIEDMKEGRLKPLSSEEVVIFIPQGSAKINYVQTIDKYNNKYHTLIDSEGLACLLFVQKGVNTVKN